MTKRRTNRKTLKALKRTGMVDTRPWNPRLDALEPLTYAIHGVSVLPHQRCHALGLENGDCRFPRTDTSLYCYYHEKLQKGLCDPSVPSPEEADQRDGMALYPVWPLPAEGYALLGEPARRLALAG